MENTAELRVADAPSNNWVYRVLPQVLWPYAQLARWDRPIGWRLLLAPCWWSLAMALNVKLGHGSPANDIIPQFVLFIVLFMVGAIAMRGAGCTYNDLVDEEYDAKVARTASRPIPSGRVSRSQAKLFLLLQLAVGAIILYSFNWFAIWLGIASLIIVMIYPFAKRVTDWPQFVLGLAFSWGALLGWAAIFATLDWPPLVLYWGSILWVIGYDTIYAHQDTEDDALIGVRSTARLFGARTKPVLAMLYTGALVLFGLAFWLSDLAWPAYLGVAAGAAQMMWQIKVLDINDPEQCLKLFKSNRYFGWLVFLGLLAAAFAVY